MYEKILGIDFGERQQGLAIGDTASKQARPLVVLREKSLERVLGRIEEAVKEWEVRAVVLGYPLQLDGEKQEITLKVERFAQRLKERVSLPIYFSDERYSSKIARSLSRRGVFGKVPVDAVDAVAAAVILQTWLENY